MTTVSSVGTSKAKDDDLPLAQRLRRKSRAHWIPGAGLVGLAFGLLVLGAILLAANQSRLRDNLRWVDHTQNVLREAANLDIAIVDVESSARAYILTNDPSYLDNYHAAREIVDDTLGALSG